MSQTAMAAALVATGIVQETPSKSDDRTGRPVSKKMEVGGFRVGNTEKITVKFRISDPALVPESCKRQRREAQATLEADYAVEALKNGLTEAATVGRHRTGRVDTGEPMVLGADGKQAPLHAVSVGDLLTDLAALGWVLTDPSYYVRNGETQAFFVQLDYEKNKAPFPLTDGDEASIAKIIGDRIWTLFSFNNPDGSVTVNLNGRQEGRPKWLLSAKDAVLTVVPRPKD